MTLKETEVSYLAGLFDGEGCVAVYSRIGKSGSEQYSFQAKISNTERVLLLWVKDRFGGGVVKESGPPIGKRRQSYVWYACNANAERFFRLIRPYVQIKGPQIDLALSLREGFARRRDEKGRSIRVPAHIRDERRRVIADLKALKGRVH